MVAPGTPFAAHLRPVVSCDAPAKINVFLEVLGKRPDRFHEIATVMVAISLTDRVSLRPILDSPDLSVNMRWSDGLIAQRRGTQERIAQGAVAPFPPPKENTVYRALSLLQQRAGIRHGAEVQIVKSIPLQAGLGGASSNAAAALQLASVGWGLHWNTAQLAEIAAQVGSDVPFFLSGPAALCRGRGEQIEPIDQVVPFWLVVVKPPQGLSTADVYRHCQPAREPRPIKPVIQALASGSPSRWTGQLFNRLTEPAEALCPTMAHLGNQLRTLDLPAFSMTGSGSSWFAICRHRRHAEQTARRLRGLEVGRVHVASSFRRQRKSVDVCITGQESSHEDHRGSHQADR